MSWNAITQIFRLIKSNKLTSFINIFGLGIGLGCTILMATYIIHEFSFDSYHKNSDKIYRVVIEKDCSIPYAMGETIGNEISGFEKIFRIYSVWNTRVKSGEDYNKEDGFILADQEIFSVLDIPIVLGKAQNLLQAPSSLVISDRVAHKYFGNENPLGNSLEVNVSGRKVNFNITGVFKRFPSYSSIQADWIGNIAEAFPIMTNASDIFGKLSTEDAKNIRQNWDKTGFQTFALTSGQINIKEASRKCTAIYQSHKPNDKREVYLQPFKQMYLHSENVYSTSPLKTSQLDTIKIYATIATLILLIACINYILLSIADAKKQLKEVACRKVNGASSFQIQKKFLLQSVFISFLSLIPALFFVALIIPLFNQLYDKNLSMQLFLQPPYLMMLAVFILVTGLLAGAYISFYASRLNPLSLLSPVSVKSKSSGAGNGILIAVQFIVFIFLFSSTLVMEKQLLFSKNGNPGFDVNNVLIFRLDNKEAQNHFSAIKSIVEKNPHVINVAGSHTTPPTQSFMQLTVDNGDKGKIDEEGLFVCDGLISLLKIPIVEGYDYSPEKPQDKAGGLIINQTAAKKYKVRAGELLSGYFVRAVVADFHAHSLHRFINPLMLLHVDDKDATELVVRTDGNNKQVVDDLNTIWKDMAPSTFLEYELLSDRIAGFYAKEEKQAKSVMFFTFMAIFLSIMGLFGYVSLVLIQRTKEIGIRKVSGARVSEVMAMLNRDFVKWVAIAFLIATPIAYYAMNKWLESFAYKTDLSWWIFALAGLLALGIALLTVSWQSWKAATRNPVEALRYE
jgi:putative ABC transport system permease protein